MNLPPYIIVPVEGDGDLAPSPFSFNKKTDAGHSLLKGEEHGKEHARS